MQTIIGPEEYAKLVKRLAGNDNDSKEPAMNADYQQFKTSIAPRKQPEKLFYFAYGSNMCPAQMKQRCPRSRPYATGKLRNWKFMINERGVATLQKATGCRTLGAIYEVTPLDLSYLDIHEGVSIGRYGRFYLPIEIWKTTHVLTCVVYIDPSVNYGVPREGYLERVIRGAKFHGLPRKYIRKLKDWRSYEYENEQQKSFVCLRDVEEGRWEPPAPTGE